MAVPSMLEVSGGIATITFARPEVGNSFDLQSAHDLATALATAEADPSCSALVIRAEGPLFSAGGDVSAMAAADDPSELLAELVVELGRTPSHLARTRLPILCVVHGAVAGAGLLFPLLADYVIATPSARFVSAYASVGLSPDCGVSYLLPRSIGERRALRFSLTGERLDAPTALDWGLVDEVAEPDMLDERVAAALSAFGRSAPQSVAVSRRLLRDVDALDAHLAREADEIVALARTDDTRTRIRRFATK